MHRREEDMKKEVSLLTFFLALVFTGLVFVLSASIAHAGPMIYDNMSTTVDNAIVGGA